MKDRKSIAVVLILAIVAFSATTAFADKDTSIESEGEYGGLGRGLDRMVRSILGESQESYEAVSPQAAPTPTSMMMQANPAADMKAAAPTGRAMTFKAAQTQETIEQVVVTEERLHEHIRTLLRDDSSLQSVDTAETHVRVTYTHPVKIFRFVPVTARITVAAYASGEVEIGYPWYAFATKTLARGFDTRVRAMVEPTVPKGEFSLETQAALVDEIYTLLSETFGASVHGER